MATVFVIDPIGYSKEFRGWKGVVGQWLYDKTTDVERVAKIEAPGPGKLPLHNRTGLNYGTGVLQNRIKAARGHWGPELEGRVVAIPKHALWVHEGTPPHAITAKPGGLLVFDWPKAGGTVYLKRVKHPGMMANPFLARALSGVMRFS